MATFQKVSSSPSGIANKLLSALAVSANVQVIVCVKESHTRYAASESTNTDQNC